MAEEKKGFFGNIFGIKEDKAAKEAANKAAAAAEELKAKAEAAAKEAKEKALADVAELKAKAKEAAKVAEDNAKRVADAAAKKAEAEALKLEYEARKVADKAAEAAKEMEGLIAKHTVAEGETLGHIAKHYYDNANLYPIIYEANKEVIGPNADMIKVGMVLVIPVKPEN